MRVDFSDFQNFFDLATGHRKYEANRAVGLLLSSLFSLLSSRCVRPSRLRTRRGQGHGDCICARDSGEAGRCRKGSVPLWRLHCGTSGGLLGSLCSLLSSLFSVLSSLSALFPLLSLPLISQIAPRTCPFDLRIRPSTSPPTASTLCGSLPGPAECAKRLNNMGYCATNSYQSLLVSTKSLPIAVAHATEQ